MTRKQFEALVDKALRRLPRGFREKIANIAVVVEDWADDETLEEMGIEPPDTLYGLYRGIDITHRDSSYGNVLPDVITIYQGPREVEAMLAEMLGAWGRIDILVSNAGLQRDAAFTEMTLEQWNTVLGVNLTGMFLCARAAARAMIRQGVDPTLSRAAGKIICVSSVHVVILWAGHVNYAASKGRLELLMQSIARELVLHRIRVTS